MGLPNVKFSIIFIRKKSFLFFFSLSKCLRNGGLSSCANHQPKLRVSDALKTMLPTAWSKLNMQRQINKIKNVLGRETKKNGILKQINVVSPIAKLKAEELYFSDTTFAKKKRRLQCLTSMSKNSWPSLFLVISEIASKK